MVLDLRLVFSISLKLWFESKIALSSLWADACGHLFPHHLFVDLSVILHVRFHDVPAGAGFRQPVDITMTALPHAGNSLIKRRVQEVKHDEHDDQSNNLVHVHPKTRLGSLL